MTVREGDRVARFAALRADPDLVRRAAEAPSPRPVLLRCGIQAAAGVLLSALGTWFSLASPPPAPGEEPWAITRILPVVNAVAGAALALWAVWKAVALLRSPVEVASVIVAEVRTDTSGGAGTVSTSSPGEAGAGRPDDPLGSVVVVIEGENGARRECETPAAVAAHLVPGALGVAQVRGGWLLGFLTPRAAVTSASGEPSAPR